MVADQIEHGLAVVADQIGHGVAVEVLDPEDHVGVVREDRCSQKRWVVAELLVLLYVVEYQPCLTPKVCRVLNL